MSLPILPGGFAPWCEAALFAWLAVCVIGAAARAVRSAVPPALTALGGALLIAAATLGGNGTLTLPAPFALGVGPAAFSADPLSRWFLAVIGLVSVPTALFTPGYLEHLRERVSPGFVWAGLAALLASMSLVVLAANAVTFLVAWEVMALSSFALVASDHGQRSIRRAALVYLGATRTGTAALMGGFLWAHHLTGSWAFADWHLAGASALGPGILILIGLGVKAGCWPFHLWLPIAHPAAPAPVSAVMSGVMLKTAIYAIIRLFVIGDHIVHPALGQVVLAAGAVSAVWGVLFALLQHDLKRLLAYHSVENIGIILIGVGLAIVGRRHGMPLVAGLGLAAALFHTLNHALFKSLLFLGAGVVDVRAHTRDIERLGGLIHRMPWTAGSFILGSAAICALPPLNGFASEWVLYTAFLELSMQPGGIGMRMVGLALMGWLALIGGLAIACFVKAIGVAFLGVPRSRQAAAAAEGSRGMVAAQVLLAACCVLAGLAAPVLLSPLAAICAMDGAAPPIRSAWTLPIPALAAAGLALGAALAVLLHALGRHAPARRFITWECGFGALGPRSQYTATSFAQPISRLFGAVYRYAIEVSVQGGNRRHFPEAVEVDATHEAYLETRLYRPLSAAIKRGAGVFLMRLQAGSIHQYLWYMALVLGLLLWVGERR